MKCKSFDSKWYTHFSQQSMQGKNKTRLLESSQAYMAGFVSLCHMWMDPTWEGASCSLLPSLRPILIRLCMLV